MMTWYTLEEGKCTKEKITLKYSKEDVDNLIKKPRGWNIGWVLEELVSKQIRREGREEVERNLLHTKKRDTDI